LFSSVKVFELGFASLFAQEPGPFQLAYWKLVEGLTHLPLIAPMEKIVGAYFVQSWGWLLVPINSFVVVWVFYDLTVKLNTIFLRTFSVLKNYNIHA